MPFPPNTSKCSNHKVHFFPHICWRVINRKILSMTFKWSKPEAGATCILVVSQQWRKIRTKTQSCLQTGTSPSPSPAPGSSDTGHAHRPQGKWRKEDNPSTRTGEDCPEQVQSYSLRREAALMVSQHNYCKDTPVPNPAWKSMPTEQTLIQ